MGNETKRWKDRKHTFCQDVFIYSTIDVRIYQKLDYTINLTNDQ